MTKKKIALVTGANKGLGFETSRQLAQLDIKVLMGSRNKRRGAAALEKLLAEGLDVDTLQLDVTNTQHIAGVYETIKKKFGRLDILVNNAGMAHPEEHFFSNSAAVISGKALRRTFAVNFFGLVELTQKLLPLIRKSPAGRIVNLSSLLGSLTLQSDPAAGIEDVKPLAYDASKAAVNQFTIHLAGLLRDTPIKVNSAHPGWAKTDIGGKEAPLDAADGAKTSVALATLGDDGPSGGFFHLEESLPW